MWFIRNILIWDKIFCVGEFRVIGMDRENIKEAERESWDGLGDRDCLGWL